MTYEQLIPYCRDEYVLLGYADNLDKVIYEQRMVKETPAHYFKFGEDEKEARLCVLWHFEIAIRDKQEAAA